MGISPPVCIWCGGAVSPVLHPRLQSNRIQQDFQEYHTMARALLVSIITILMLLCGSIQARLVYVATAPDLVSAMRTAVAGDTILIAAGTYSGDMQQSGDPGNQPNGKGYFWIGSDGTAQHPIVVVSATEDNPPVLQGSSIESGYVVHVTGDYVILKNLVLRDADKGVVFDNASHGIIEDCAVYNSGAELIHVRDGSSHVTISRNHVYGAGNGGRGSIGEGIYIGTDQARWGADDMPQSTWGEKAISEGYGGYDWRVHHTRLLCNLIGGGISAECIDIKEGTQYTLVEGNMLVGDSIALKPGAESYDDSFIDQKGVRGTFTGNTFCACGNDIDKYISEVTRAKYDHVSDSLTADDHSSPWCDDSYSDSNSCSAADNAVVTDVIDPRPGCAEVFGFDWAALDATRLAQARCARRYERPGAGVLPGRRECFSLSGRTVPRTGPLPTGIVTIKNSHASGLRRHLIFQ
ncbi:MAG: hypothetical protein GF398_17965 [Chitinivibrionales bacterium]|nr:hypothetical protein [Chitinivibrionales bacterium]